MSDTLFFDPSLVSIDSTDEKIRDAVYMPKQMDTFYYQPDKKIPAYLNKRPGMDAGYDLYASKDVWLLPFQTKTIPSNSHIYIPAGHLGRVTSRSGHADRGWLTHPGTVDNGYTGCIGIIQTNLSIFPRRIKKGERIAQLIFMPFTAMKLEEINTFYQYKLRVQQESKSNRGTQARNSSGKY